MRRITAGSAMVALLAFSAGAQESVQTEPTRWLSPGSDAESYLRSLQTLGLVPLHPWSVRGFSAREARLLAPRDSAGPWGSSPVLMDRVHRLGGLRLRAAPASLNAWYNTAFPFGMNDGAVWAGRGLTAAVSA
jgi:hypothetical protein